MPLAKKSPPRQEVIAKQAKKSAHNKGQAIIGRAKPGTAQEDKPKSTPTGESGTYEGYCVKCKEKGVKFTGEVFVNAKGGKIAKGPHDKCGTTVCRILGKNA